MASAAGRPSPAQRADQRSRRRAAALISYFDTSALIKLLIEEDGSSLADEVWSRSSSRISSQLVYPEARAALAAAKRVGRIDEPSLRAAVSDLDSACAAMQLIGVDGELARRAGAVAEQYALRGYDAVHLATALQLQGSEFALISWDGALALAAVSAGLVVVPS